MAEQIAVILLTTCTDSVCSLRIYTICIQLELYSALESNFLIFIWDTPGSDATVTVHVALSQLDALAFRPNPSIIPVALVYKLDS